MGRKTSLAGSIGIAALFALGFVGFLSPSAAAASTLQALQSTNCPTGFGLTPAGCAPLSCIHVLNDAYASITRLSDGDTLVTFSNGQQETFPPCMAPSPKINTNGWVEAAYDNTLIKQVSGKYLVPKAPTHNDDQTIFMFTGSENEPQTDIIQPVIQWGSSAAGGGAYWALASWYVGNNYFVSKLIDINVGDMIYGIQTSSHCNKTGGCDWVITGKDVTKGTSTTLKYNGLDAQEHAVVTLEVYGVLECADYPASGSTTFHDLKVDKGTPSWVGTIFQNDGCGENVTIVNDQTVTLSY